VGGAEKQQAEQEPPGDAGRPPARLLLRRKERDHIMAFALALVGIEWRGGHYFVREFSREIEGAEILRDDPRFRRIAVCDGYADAFAVLSPSEALAIARQHYQHLASIWGSEGKQAEDALHEVEVGLKDVAIVLAHIFEWESGLD
jgi:hypothetical protein